MNTHTFDPRTFDARALRERAAEQAARLIASVRPDQLESRTPCAEFDVRQLLGHLVGGALRFTHATAGGALADLPADPRAVPDDGYAKAYTDAQERLARTVAQTPLDTVVTLPWGSPPLRMALGVALMETVTHTWDLWQALGRPGQLDPELGRVALDVARLSLAADRRGEGVPFGPVQTVPEGADVHEQLAAWLGRTPLT